MVRYVSGSGQDRPEKNSLSRAFNRVRGPVVLTAALGGGLYAGWAALAGSPVAAPESGPSTAPVADWLDGAPDLWADFQNPRGETVQTAPRTAGSVQCYNHVFGPTIQTYAGAARAAQTTGDNAYLCVPGEVRTNTITGEKIEGTLMTASTCFVRTPVTENMAAAKALTGQAYLEMLRSPQALRVAAQILAAPETAAMLGDAVGEKRAKQILSGIRKNGTNPAAMRHMAHQLLQSGEGPQIIQSLLSAPATAAALEKMSGGNPDARRVLEVLRETGVARLSTYCVSTETKIKSFPASVRRPTEGP